MRLRKALFLNDLGHSEGREKKKKEIRNLVLIWRDRFLLGTGVKGKRSSKHTEPASQSVHKVYTVSRLIMKRDEVDLLTTFRMTTEWQTDIVVSVRASERLCLLASPSSPTEAENGTAYKTSVYTSVRV